MATKRSAKKPKQTFRVWTVFQLKSDFSTSDKYLSSKWRAEIETSVLTIPDALSAVLHIKKLSETEPSWAKQFRGIADPPISVRSKTAAALMVITTGNATFALSFGFGRALMDPDAWEQEFGLKVTLNNIDDEGIKHIQLSAFDSLLQNKQTQAVRNARIDEFGLDVEQDVIRSLTGKPKDELLGRQLGGRDSLRISTTTSLTQLPALLDRILSDSVKDDYLQVFSWVGRMKEVRGKSLKTQLDDLLVEKLSGQSIERVWMAPPTCEDWDAGRTFNIHGVTEPQDDLRLSEVLREWESEGKLDGLEIDDLRAWRVIAADDNEQERESWSVYKTLYCEIDLNGETFLLNNALWYRIDKSYLDEVNKDIDEFPTCDILLPDYNDPSEEAYNKRVSRDSPLYCLMDRKCIELKSRGFTKVEFCDLASSSKHLVHVKRYSGSSELSHLFAQGIVPAELFLNVPEFREAVNEYLGPNHKLANPKNTINPSEYEVVYAIISKSENELRLPFFSKVMLRHARRTLETMKYKVSLCKVKNIYRPTPQMIDRATEVPVEA
jgi:uncharacterized protein (TIGR04141 family)